MAQIDWLIEYSGVAAVNESFVSIVTSGDIDSVVLHLLALAYLWPRNESTGDFKNEVFVMLQKPGKVYDVFNVTAILRVFERVWKDKYIGQKIALALCLGGNDYLPKFYGISHNFTLEVFVSQQYFLEDLFQFYWEDEKLKVTVNTKTYTDFIKALYCPKSVSFKPFTFDEVRQMSIQSYKGKSTETKNPKIWMPPESVIKRLGKNVQCLANYYLTLGHHDSKMPNFLMEGCLTKTEEGDIQYDFGPDSKVTNIEECCLFRWDYLQEKLRSNRNIDGSSRASKRKLQQTPQKGRRRKIKPYTSTPRKHKDESNDNQVSQQQDSPVFMDLP